MADHGNDWHLDRRVSISIILAVATQTVALIFWSGVMAQRVSNLETALETHMGQGSHGNVSAELARLTARQELILSRQLEMIQTINELANRR